MIKVVITEDEPLIRADLRRILTAFFDVQVVAECGDVASTVIACEKHAPDILFLDIKLPDGNGTDVITKLRKKPHVVFATAYDRYAIQAFDLHALDYVLKPFRKSRIASAIQKFRDLVDRKVVEATNPRLAVRFGEIEIYLESKQLRCAVAEGNYVRITTEEGSHFVRGTIRSLEAALCGSEIIRIHRRALVNINYISALRRSRSGKRWVIVDGHRIPCSRAKEESLRAKLRSTVFNSKNPTSANNLAQGKTVERLPRARAS